MIVYFENNSEVMTYESFNKGYREDVFVVIENKAYQLNVYTMIRLKQDFELEIKDYGFYEMVPNLILVNECQEEDIIKTIKELQERGFFSALKPLKSFDFNGMYQVI
ncbi:hypothetical protein [Enterococcus sp. LJL51]|uniref:hypothetical protein n=1 Tax=Enterococcus sp. LJL51 TaxID=3416656 RepID=UPI003CF51D31